MVSPLRDVADYRAWWCTAAVRGIYARGRLDPIM